MTLLWFDGFETYYGPDDFNSLSNILSTTVSFSTSYGRRGSRGLYAQAANNNFRVGLPSHPTTIVLGYAFFINNNNLPSYNASYPFITLYDAFPSGNIHLKFHINSSRLIEVRDSSGALIGTTSGHSIEGKIWHYIEIKATISDTVGQITIKVAEIERLSTSADKDTCNGSNAYVGCAKINPTYNLNHYIDDLYICDTAGSKNNDFLGDIRVDPLRPNGAGTHTDFNPSTGSNYENVDGIYPDDDSTYNDSQDVAAGEQDSYAMESLDVLGLTIHGVKDQITVRKTDSGSREVKILTRQGASDYLGDTIILADSFTTHTRIMENNPDDSAAFVEADITSGEVGVEVTV